MSARRRPAPMPSWVLAVFAAAVVNGCSCEDPDPLKDQFRDDPFGTNAAYADGRAMRPLPSHVVPREHPRVQDALHTGVADGDYVSTIPVPVTQALLEDGRHHFEIYCATCHGLLGDGNSFVAKNMKLRPPPSLLEHREHEGPAARAMRAGEMPPWPEHRTEGENTAPPSPPNPTGQAGLAAPLSNLNRDPAAGLPYTDEGGAGERNVSGALSVHVENSIDPGTITSGELDSRAPQPGGPGRLTNAMEDVREPREFATSRAGTLTPSLTGERAEREAIARASAGTAGATSPGAGAGAGGGVHPHFRPGFVFSVISQGYGLMPSYAPELTVQERWAVIAYLDALRLSQRAQVSQLPVEMVQRVRKAEAER